MRYILAALLALAMNALANEKADSVAKKLFETNCLACHDPVKKIAGPTLYEINKIYKGKPLEIVSWAKKPGRKRTEGIAMPAMTHISDNDLKLIADYMLFTGSRISRKKLRKTEVFKEDLGKIQRTFMPSSSVVSFAINYSDDLSLCWDAEKGGTRYIWKGKIDPQSHFTGNGKVIPVIVGDVIYRSSESLFIELAPKIDFWGYKINDQGLPSFMYKRGSYEFTETHKFTNGNISWNYKISGPHKLSLKLPTVTGYKCTVTQGERQGDIVNLSQTNLSDFTIILTKGK